MTKAKLISELLHGVTKTYASPEITPVGDTELTHAIVRESPVDLEYRRRLNGDGEFERYIRVKVWSKVKHGLFRFTDIKVAGSRDEMAQKCGVTAGVMAEQLCALYGDLVEPSECAKVAGKHFFELCRHLEQQAAL